MYINPYKKTDLKLWAGKWNITLSQIKDLLGVTGSTHIEVLQNHLKHTGLIP